MLALGRYKRRNPKPLPGLKDLNNENSQPIGAVGGARSLTRPQFPALIELVLLSPGAE